MNFPLLKTLSDASAISGQEEELRTIVIKEMTPLVDEIHTDIMGNVVGVKKGSGKTKVMIAAHMDEIGFIVKYIDDKGFLCLQHLGGHDPRQLFAQRIKVFTRSGTVLPGVLSYKTKPTHMLTPEEAKQPPKIENFFVDLGLTCDEVKAQVAVGDRVTMDRTLIECGHHVTGKAIDNRVGVFVMLEALRGAWGSRGRYLCGGYGAGRNWPARCRHVIVQH